MIGYPMLGNSFPAMREGILRKRDRSTYTFQVQSQGDPSHDWSGSPVLDQYWEFLGVVEADGDIVEAQPYWKLINLLS